MDEKTTTKIIELITDNAQISRQGLADALGISLFGVDWQIRKLKADGILKYWCPLKVISIVPMCPQYYQTNIVDTFSKSKPLNQKA